MAIEIVDLIYPLKMVIFLTKVFVYQRVMPYAEPLLSLEKAFGGVTCRSLEVAPSSTLATLPRSQEARSAFRAGSWQSVWQTPYEKPCPKPPEILLWLGIEPHVLGKSLGMVCYKIEVETIVDTSACPWSTDAMPSVSVASDMTPVLNTSVSNWEHMPQLLPGCCHLNSPLKLRLKIVVPIDPENR